MTTNPKTFKEFYESKENPDLTAPPGINSVAMAASGIAACLAGAVLTNGEQFPDESRNEFGKKVSEIAHSEEFINQFSDEIGAPLASESEDQFVQRAKSAMAKMLRKKLRQ